MPDTRLMQLDSERLRQRSSSDTNGPALTSPAEHPVQRLQRQIGNAQVARMLAQRESEASEDEDEELMAKHDPVLAQRAADDEDELQTLHDPSLQRESEGAEDEDEELMAKHDPSLQRESEGAEDEGEELMAKHDRSLQRSAATEEAPRIGLEGGPVDADLQHRINSQRGGGSGLTDGIRRNMEGAFGTSFEDVRVHTGTEADSLNRAMTAKAFTTGSDIFLRNDSSPTDSNLLAHELTHVVQQRGGGGGGMHVGAAGDESEHEADSMAQTIASGSPQRLAEEIGHQH